MILTKLSTSTSDMLTSVGDVRDALGIDVETYDETVKRYIRRATAQIERYVGRPLAAQQYEARLPAYGRALRLPRYPITQVDAVSFGTDTGQVLTATEYRVDADAGLVTRDEGFSWTFQVKRDVVDYPEPGLERPDWYVRWWGGYRLVGSTSTADGTTSTGVTVDEDLQAACIELVRDAWHRRGRDGSVTSKRVGDLSLTYSQPDGASEIPAAVQQLLAPFRSVA